MRRLHLVFADQKVDDAEAPLLVGNGFPDRARPGILGFDTSAGYCRAGRIIYRPDHGGRRSLRPRLFQGGDEQ